MAQDFDIGDAGDLACGLEFIPLFDKLPVLVDETHPLLQFLGRGPLVDLVELGKREGKGFTQHRFAVPMAHLAADVIPANLTTEGLRAVAGCLWHQLMRLSWGAAPLLPHTATRFALGTFADVGRADLLPLWIVASVLRYRWSIKGYDELGSVLRANLAVGIAYMCVASCSTTALPERMPGVPLLDRSALL